jgi:heat shock protein HslJ
MRFEDHMKGGVNLTVVGDRQAQKMNRIIHYFAHLGIAAGILCGATPLVFAGTGDCQDSRPANATYHGIEDSGVKLSNGRWEGQPYDEGGASRPSVGLMEDFTLQGDLDGDGDAETVVLLWQNSGGSGTFNYVAVLKETDGKLVNAATAPLGDRVQVRGGSIMDGVITLSVVQQGEEDPACCPAELANRSWKLEGEQLEEQKTQIEGTLSVSALEGSEWLLTRLKQNHHLPEGTEVTVAFSEGRIAGHSGCNRFSAGLEEGGMPGEIRIGDAMVTRMACPEDQMNLETEFLDLLSHVSRFSFLAGQLVLGGEKESYSFMLKFKPQTEKTAN